MTNADGNSRVPQYPIESVDRALALIQMLASGADLKLSEVRAHLEIGQSTAHRLLAMFVYRGFAVQDPTTRTYAAGPALLDLGRGTGVGLDVARASRAVLVSLASASGETAHFGVLEATNVRYVDDVESQRALRVIGRVGQTRPAHATSMGRAMLAAEGEAVVRARYHDSPLPVGTHATITTVDELLEELRRTVERGYAINRGDVEPGICSAAVAVVDLDGHVLGGLSVAAPEARWTPAVERALLDLLVGAAARLSRDSAGIPRRSAE